MRSASLALVSVLAVSLPLPTALPSRGYHESHNARKL